MISTSKQIKIGAILSYVSIAVNIIAGLIYTPWMIQKIGTGQYGLYTLANTLITLFVVDFGLSTAASRYVAKYHAEGNQEKANNFLGAIYKLYLLIDLVIFAVLLGIFFFIDVIYVKLTPTELEQFKVVYVMAALFAVVKFPFVTLNGVLNAYEKYIPLKLADLLYRVLLVGSTVAALLMGGGLYALVALNALSGIVLIIYKLIVVKLTTPVKVNFAYSDKSLYKEIFGFSIWVAVASLAQRLIFNISPSILGIVASSTAIAVFGVVTTIEGYSYTVTSAIHGMFMPRISRIYAKGDSDKSLTPLLLSVGRFQYGLNGLIIAVFAVVGPLFLKLWMRNNDIGPEYMSVYYGAMLVMVPGIFYNSLEIANTALIVEKKVKLQAYIMIAVGLINVVLSFLLSSWLGVLGACLSIFAAYIVRALAFLVVYHRHLEVNIPLFIRSCYLRMSVPIVLSIAAGFGINRFIPDRGWMSFLVQSAVVAAIYFVAVFLFGLKHSERKQIFVMLRSKLRK